MKTPESSADLGLVPTLTLGPDVLLLTELVSAAFQPGPLLPPGALLAWCEVWGGQAAPKFRPVGGSRAVTFPHVSAANRCFLPLPLPPPLPEGSAPACFRFGRPGLSHLYLVFSIERWQAPEAWGGGASFPNGGMGRVRHPWPHVTPPEQGLPSPAPGTRSGAWPLGASDCRTCSL